MKFLDQTPCFNSSSVFFLNDKPNFVQKIQLLKVFDVQNNEFQINDGK